MAEKVETAAKQQPGNNKPKAQQPRPLGDQPGSIKSQQSTKQATATETSSARNVSQTSRSAKQENVNSIANQVYRMALFDHLPRKQIPKDPDSVEEDRIIHPATVHLGLLYQRGVIQHDDDRAQALLTTMMRVIADYRTPPLMTFREDLDRYIVKQIQYLVDCRQLSKGMGNIIRYIRLCVSKVAPDLSEDQSKTFIVSKLQSFLDDKILFAGESISKTLVGSIHDDDVVMTFGSSPLIRRVLSSAAKSKRFRLVVVDTRPLHEGLETLAAVTSCISCVYCPLSGAAFALKDVSKVILGASCLLSNGSMLAPAGTAMVASLAKAKQIPVIVAAESYKFSDKVQLDSIVFNELGHPSEILCFRTEEQSDGGQFGPQMDSRYRGSADKLSVAESSDVLIDTTDMITTPCSRSSIKSDPTRAPYEVVNLRYDLTPLANISAIATETGLIPPTSVPILIRENQSEVVGE